MGAILSSSHATGVAAANGIVAAGNADALLSAATYVQSVTTVTATAQAIMAALAAAQTVAGGGPNSPNKYQDGIQAMVEIQAKTAEVTAQIAKDTAAVTAAFAKV